VVGDFIIKKWKRQGIYWQEDFFLDTSRQILMGQRQHSQIPQQDSFHNNCQTALACGHYSVLSSMYAVLLCFIIKPILGNRYGPGVIP